MIMKIAKLAIPPTNEPAFSFCTSYFNMVFGVLTLDEMCYKLHSVSDSILAHYQNYFLNVVLVANT